MRRLSALIQAGLSGLCRYGIYGMALIGLIAHGGTALLRLDTFFPYPRLVDFAAFYTASHALRVGLSPYTPPAGWLENLQREQHIPFRPPTIYNPPFWPWIVQPLTYLRFPQAAWLWTAFNVLLLLGCAWELTRLAALEGILPRLCGIGAVLVFGPVFLDLTIGQTSIVLLAAALVMGKALATRRTGMELAAGLASGVAFGAKVFPLAWVGSLLLPRRWRMFAIAMIVVVLIVAVGWIVAAETHIQYWSHTLLSRVSSTAETPGLDDQSLMSWIARCLLPQAYGVPGLRVDELTRVEWVPPWRLERSLVWAIGYALSLLLLMLTLYAVWRAAPDQQDGAFFLAILCTLLILPHMERYNHTLLLPAMAWLWPRGDSQRGFAVGAYTLSGLARLNHLWATALPAPLAPLLTGFGISAVLVLMWGIALELGAFSLSLKQVHL